MKRNNNMRKGFASLGILVLVAIGLIAGYLGARVEHKVSEPSSPTVGSILTVGGKNYYLYGGGIGTSDSSITLTSFKTPVSNYQLLMADFGTLGYVTIEPGSNTRQEFVSFTGVTPNSDGTATLTGVVRGLSPVSPYAASTTLQTIHAGGSVVVISNPPSLYNQFTAKANNELITGQWTASSTNPLAYDLVWGESASSTSKKLTYNSWVFNNFMDVYSTQTITGAKTFSSAVTIPLTPSAATDAASKGYVDTGVLAGCANSTLTVKGCVELATSAEILNGTATGGTGAALVLTPDAFLSAYGNGSTTLIVATTSVADMATTSIRSIPFGRHIHVSANFASTSDQSIRICFNEDWSGCVTAANLYSYSYSNDGGSPITGASKTFAYIGSGGAGNRGTRMNVELDIYNSTSTTKFGSGLAFQNNTTIGTFSQSENGLSWASSTASINQISFISEKPNLLFGAGTVISVYILP